MRIGEILLEYGYITKEQLSYALDCQKSQTVRKRLGELMVELNMITAAQQLTAISRQTGISVVDLETYRVDSVAVEKIPKQIAVKYTALAISIKDSQLLVAVNDPMNLYAIEDIRLATNLQVRLMLAEKEALVEAIDLHYSEVDARAAVFHANENAILSVSFMDELSAMNGNEQAPIVRLLNSLLLKGYNTNVSDIHIEPSEHETVIRMRRDGMLLPYITLSSSLHEALTARIKILAQMDIAEKRRPQDGHFHLTLEDVQLHIRVSFVPTAYGEKGVLRYLTTNTRIDYSSTFGMEPRVYEKMLRLLKRPHGLVYITGPTGSGKTTTLYSVLQHLSAGPVNISTIEEPIERSIPGLSQIQVNAKAGITFESGLRALLRQDPDIIMVGETRDSETALIAARAAITGHLVFSTLHTNDAVSTIVRLLDLGLQPYMAANSLAGIVAQRLVKKVCSHCAKEYDAEESEIRLLYGDDMPSHPVRIRKGTGCHLCDGTGYKGRVAVYEILEIDKTIRRMVSEGASTEALYQYVRNELHTVSLADEVRALVRNGVTDMAQMRQITMEQEE